MSSRKNFFLCPYIIAPKYSDISEVKCKCSNDIVLEKTYNFCPNCGKEIKKTNEISYGYLLNDEITYFDLNETSVIFIPVDKNYRTYLNNSMNEAGYVEITPAEVNNNLNIFCAYYNEIIDAIKIESANEHIIIGYGVVFITI